MLQKANTADLLPETGACSGVSVNMKLNIKLNILRYRHKPIEVAAFKSIIGFKKGKTGLSAGLCLSKI